jgi:hypothetical protein
LPHLFLNLFQRVHGRIYARLNRFGNSMHTLAKRTLAFPSANLRTWG